MEVAARKVFTMVLIAALDMAWAFAIIKLRKERPNNG